MTIFNTRSTIVLILITLLSACSVSKNKHVHGEEAYVASSLALHDSIVAMDSIWGHAYNTCDTAQLGAVISDDLEFYHDRGGLQTSKEAVMQGYQKYVCGKVYRELLKGSIEVYPIPNFGAVQLGRHKFYSTEEERKSPHYSKFVHIWQSKDGKWQITRVVSLH